MKYTIIYILLFAVITACQRQPTANFTTDKTEYTAGDVVHLKDASVHAYNWKWTTPDGKTYTTQNLDFPLDSDDLGGEKLFKLEVFSKRGKKTATETKTIKVNQYILPSDYFAIDNNSFKPITKMSYKENNSWVIYAEYNATNNSGGAGVYIYLPNPTQPTTAMTFNLQKNSNTLTTNKASVRVFTNWDSQGLRSFSSISGQLIISIANNGKVNAQFNDINANGYGSDSTSTFLISGNITCH